MSKLKVVNSNYFLFFFSFLFSFQFIFLYSIFRTRVRVKVMRLCCHILVISDDTVTVMVTSYMMHGKK